MRRRRRRPTILARRLGAASTAVAPVAVAVLLLAVIAVTAAASPAPPADGGVDGRAAPEALPSSSPDQVRVVDDGVPPGVETIYGTGDVVRTGGGAGVTVGVLDTGVDPDHPDLRDRIVGCRDYTGADPPEPGCQDRLGHGSLVAGIVAADGGPDGTGLYGVAPEARILAYKVCGRATTCRMDDVARALEDAVAAGADVVLMSLGSEIPYPRDRIREAADGGALVVAASGNSGPSTASIAYPAAAPSVVSVGAVGRRGEAGEVEPSQYAVPEFSSRGRRRESFATLDGVLEVAAPGVDVVSTGPEGGYRSDGGTSMAAPHIAGLAARLWTRVDDEDGDGKRDDVREALWRRAHAFDVTSGRHADDGYDPAAGLGVPQARPPRPTIAVDPAVPTRGRAVTFRADDDRSGDTGSVRYEWRFPASGDAAAGAAIGHRFERSGRLPVEVRATAPDGTTVARSTTVPVNAPPTAAFTYRPRVPLANETVALDGGNATDSDGAIARYAWDVGPDGAVEATGERATVRFPRPGRTAVELTVRDGDGGSDSVTRQLLVNDRPALAVDAPETVVPGENVTLRATVEDRVGSVAVRWRLPGDRTATGRTVTARFDEGDHTVAATATDEHGAEATRRVTVSAVPQPVGLPQGPPMPFAVPAVVAAAALLVRRRRR